jgi:hypothetical protein
MKKRYSVYFDQVNQDRYDVDAETVAEAVQKAEREWRRDHGEPELIGVETDDEEVKP